MNVERIHNQQAEVSEVDADLLDSERFDLTQFFSEKDNEHEEALQLSAPELLVTLRDEAQQSITTLTTKITPASFATGVSLTSNVFSTLGSLVGSCGVFCAHSLSNIGSMSQGLSGAPGLANGSTIPGFSVDKNGNVHIDGTVDSLSRATGISQRDLLSGKFSAANILMNFFSIFGEGMSFIFGFGLAETVLDCFFDSFLPSGSNSREMLRAA